MALRLLMGEGISVETLKEYSSLMATKVFKIFILIFRNFLQKEIYYTGEIFAIFMSNKKPISFRFKELLK